MSKTRNFIIFIIIHLLVFSYLFNGISIHPLNKLRNEDNKNLRDYSNIVSDDNIRDGESSYVKPSSTSTVPPHEENSASSFENEKVQRSFQYSKNCNSETKEITINNCENWTINSTFDFNNIRSEKFTNGNAESSEDFWTEFLPASYQTNLSRESNPSKGEVISGDYSWYHNITSTAHTTSVGLEKEINFSSDSVIFSFSYSLLENSLGTTYDSNICIRLFFEFDIYIFFWFNGNPDVLSNVTGPGGYADLLIQDSSFDASINHYSLNITALGLELFGQKPETLTSFAIQSWGEDPYHMEFMIDDLSLNDRLSPLDADLKVNSKPVTGTTGTGSVSLSGISADIVNFEISSNEEILWDCQYSIQGYAETLTRLSYSFLDYSYILLSESASLMFGVPLSTEFITLYKWVPKNWTVEQIVADSSSISYSIQTTNSTHKKIKSTLHYTKSELQIQYLVENNILDLSLSKKELAHNDSLTISVKSRIIDEELTLWVFAPSSALVCQNKTCSNETGTAIFEINHFKNNFSRGNYSVIIFWFSGLTFGLGQESFKLITIPAIVLPIKETHTINFSESAEIGVNYHNLEDNISIHNALITYEWAFGVGRFQNSINGSYIANLSTINASPGLYELIIRAKKSDYASANCQISLSIVIEGLSIRLSTPDSASPGEHISISTLILNNLSRPVANLSVSFLINNESFKDTITNSSGYATIMYEISRTYIEETLNVSCLVIFDDYEIISQSKKLSINIFNLERVISLGLSKQFNSNNGSDLIYFSFPIIYPSVGLKWRVGIPPGFDPVSAKVISENENCSVTISSHGFLSWERRLMSLPFEGDFLLLGLEPPNPSFQTETTRKELVINISIITNYVPYQELIVTIDFKEADWSVFDNWALYRNGSQVSKVSDFQLVNNKFIFKIDSTNTTYLVNYQIKGIRKNLVQIAPTTILLGIGLVALTVSSTALLIKKRSTASLEIEV
ncbi:MAG: hypothetical protein GF308_15555 [Candidatus Heimdallarchaeota archaeon]|nr:hypothetical protein [Candidatus Heimdallarchaeota archaeon]